MTLQKTKMLINTYLAETKTMQLATVGEGGKPWICNVYFVADVDKNIYWLSEPTRRHSKEIAENPNVAISIAVKTDMPVIGLQADGTARHIGDLKTIKNVMIKYIKKYGVGKEFYMKAVKGIGKHRVYKMSVSKFSLLDEVNYPKDSPREWKL